MRYLALAFALTLVPVSVQAQEVVRWGAAGGPLRYLPKIDASPAQDVGAGYLKSASLREDGTVVVWGDTPLPPAGLSNVVDLSVGGSMLALRADGTVVAWGTTTTATDMPEGLSGITQVAAGYRNGLALRADSTVVTWPYVFFDDLDDVVQIDSGDEMAVALRADGTVASWGIQPPAGLDDVVQVDAGYQFALALRADGSVVAWGSGSSSGTHVPPDLGPAVAVSAGLFAAALLEDGSVVTWGGGPRVPPEVRLVAISAGEDHLLGRTASGEVLAWGGNEYGEAAIPRGITSPTSVAIGQFHGLVLLTDGTVASWGADDYGSASAVPENLSSVVQIAAGNDTSFSLLEDGTLVSWGADWVNQRPPEGLTGVAQVEAFGFGSAVLFENGKVETWGSFPDTPALSDVTQIAAATNTVIALLEDGTVEAVSINPNQQPPPGLSGVVQVAVYDYNALALLADGTVVAWGNMPSPPEGLTDVIQIAAGGGHGLALRADGSVVGWGSNGNGQATPPEGLVATSITASGATSYAITVAPTTASAPTAQPLASMLHAPAPNPASGAVSVGYALARGGPVLMDVLDLTGRRVATLTNGMQTSGEHTAT